MMKPLPDYYSILKVQPDASQEVIKASYRKLMVRLKMHPDLGGSNEMAAEINEAYSVLGDKARRTAYARLYLLQRLRAVQAAVRPTDHRAGNGAGPLPATTAASSIRSPDPTDDLCCPLCRVLLPESIGPETRCERCHSPLSPPPQPGSYGHELFGRRASGRSVRTHTGKVMPAGQSQCTTVRMRDLSLNGISFFAESELTPDQVFNYRDQNLEALAVVVSCQKRGRLYSVHARLLTVAFHRKVGVFVSSSG